MSDDINSVPILLRREIEALMAAPLIKAFSDEFGKTETIKVVEKVIASLAEEAGRNLAKAVEGNSLADMNKVLSMFGASGALEVETVHQSDTKMAFNVVRCRYAERYRELGLEEYGFLLSCNRDGYLFQGYNPDLKFTRTKTLMEGGDCCDFCLEQI